MCTQKKLNFYPTVYRYAYSRRLSESSRAATHDLALADKLGVEFGPIKRKVNVEVDAIESALGCIHAFEVFFEVLPGEIRGECNNLLDTCAYVSTCCAVHT